MKNSTAILALLVFTRRSRTKNTENNKFFSNFQFQLLNYLGADCEKQIISSRDCNEVAVSNHFIRCLRLFKKLSKKFMMEKLVSMVLIATNILFSYV